MKRIGVLRHGKAEHTPGMLSDFERKLTPKGEEKVASLAGNCLTQFGHPDCIFSSPAVRALRTSEILVQSAGFSSRIEIHEELYAADMQDIMDLMAGLPEEMESVIIVGHNPSIEDLLADLCREYIRLKPAYFYMIDLDIQSWDEIFGKVSVMNGKILKP